MKPELKRRRPAKPTNVFYNATNRSTTQPSARSMKTVSGNWIDITYPVQAGIELSDIALHLSKLCRWNGATPDFYSVAEHSVIMANLAEHLELDYMCIMHALMHDAHEYIIGDQTNPFVHAMTWFAQEHGDKSFGHCYRKLMANLKDRVDASIFNKLDIATAPLTYKAVKVLDRIMLHAENKMFFPIANHDDTDIFLNGFCKRNLYSESINTYIPNAVPALSSEANILHAVQFAMDNIHCLPHIEASVSFENAFQEYKLAQHRCSMQKICPRNTNDSVYKKS